MVLPLRGFPGSRAPEASLPVAQGMNKWKIRVPGRQPIGPVSTELVVRGIELGRVPLTAEVCEVGTEAWSSLTQVDEFYEALGLDDAQTSLIRRDVPDWSDSTDNEVTRAFHPLMSQRVHATPSPSPRRAESLPLTDASEDEEATQVMSGPPEGVLDEPFDAGEELGRMNEGPRLGSEEPKGPTERGAPVAAGEARTGDGGEVASDSREAFADRVAPAAVEEGSLDDDDETSTPAAGTAFRRPRSNSAAVATGEARRASPALAKDPSDLMDADDDDGDRRVIRSVPVPGQEIPSVRPAAGAPSPLQVPEGADRAQPSRRMLARAEEFAREHGDSDAPSTEGWTYSRNSRGRSNPDAPDELTAPSLRVRREYARARVLLFVGLGSLALALVLVAVVLVQ